MSSTQNSLYLYERIFVSDYLYISIESNILQTAAWINVVLLLSTLILMLWPFNAQLFRTKALTLFKNVVNFVLTNIGNTTNHCSRVYTERSLIMQPNSRE